jgi:hypothetical protein
MAMHPSEFKHLFDEVQRRSKVVEIRGQGFIVYADHFEVPYRAGDLRLFLGEGKNSLVAVVDLNKVEHVVSPWRA